MQVAMNGADSNWLKGRQLFSKPIKLQSSIKSHFLPFTTFPPFNNKPRKRLRHLSCPDGSNWKLYMHVELRVGRGIQADNQRGFSPLQMNEKYSKCWWGQLVSDILEQRRRKKEIWVMTKHSVGLVLAGCLPRNKTENKMENSKDATLKTPNLVPFLLREKFYKAKGLVR